MHIILVYHLCSFWNFTSGPCAIEVTVHWLRYSTDIVKFVVVLFSLDVCRQLQDQETGRSVVAPRDLRELMALLPNIDLGDTLEIPRVFQCDEQTLPCDHTSRYQSITGWCNNLRHPEWGKSLRAFVRLLPPAYNDGKVGLLYDFFRTGRESWTVTACHAKKDTATFLQFTYLQPTMSDIVCTSSAFL